MKGTIHPDAVCSHLLLLWADRPVCRPRLRPWKRDSQQAQQATDQGAEDQHAPGRDRQSSSHTLHELRCVCVSHHGRLAERRDRFTSQRPRRTQSLSDYVTYSFKIYSCCMFRKFRHGDPPQPPHHHLRTVEHGIKRTCPPPPLFPTVQPVRKVSRGGRCLTGAKNKVHQAEKTSLSVETCRTAHLRMPKVKGQRGSSECGPCFKVKLASVAVLSGGLVQSQGLFWSQDVHHPV